MYAVQEARDLFWGTFAAGKGFAKRASMWDLLFMGIGSMGRDENMMAFVFRFAFQVKMMINIVIFFFISGIALQVVMMMMTTIVLSSSFLFS